MKREGFSLALTLWIVAMLSLASVLYLNHGRNVVKKSRQLETKLLLTFKAESVVELLKFYGSTGIINGNYISNSKVQEYYPTFPKKVFIDSRVLVWDNTSIILQDTAGLIDIDDTKALVNYIKYEFEGLKDKTAIIKDSIGDWIDIDNASSLNGAEDNFYGKFTYSTRSRGYWAALEELFLIREMNSLNSKQQDKILSYLVISNQKRRNLLTLDNNLLQSIYTLSSSDAIELQKAKDTNNLNYFMSYFNSIYKENYDFEKDGGTPSQIIKAKVFSTKSNIKKEIVFTVSFLIRDQKKFEVLNYKD